jgi:hypothetical protein
VVGNPEPTADIDKFEAADAAGHLADALDGLAVIREIVGQNAAAGMRMEANKLELLADALGDRGHPLVGDPELGVVAGGDLLVVARPDAGVDADRHPAVVVAFGEPIKGVGRADRDCQAGGVSGEIDSILEIVGRWVDRGVLDGVRIGTGLDCPFDFTTGRTLDIRATSSSDERTA